MGKEFEYFLKDEGFAPAFARRDVDSAYAEQYRGRLPDQLLSYWLEHGWCGYAEGLFWTVNPADYTDVVEAWLADTPFADLDDYYVIARSAFGELYLWGTRTGNGIDIKTPYGWFLQRARAAQSIPEGKADASMRAFFSHQMKKYIDFTDVNQIPLFARALKRLGRLEYDEMYGFEPALGSTNEPKLAQLRKVKAVEHLLILAQLGERKVLGIQAATEPKIELNPYH